MPGAVQPNVRDLVDVELERSFVAALIANPEMFVMLPEAVGLDVLSDFQAKKVFEAIANVDAAKTPITRDTVRAEVVRACGHLDIPWFEKFTIPMPSSPPVFAWADQLVALAMQREYVIADIDAAERDTDDAALKDTEPEPEPAPASVPPAAKSDPLCPPLVEFLGEDEPDDNDAEDWIIRDIVPRCEPCLWGGPMKGGKTWSALDLLISMALGTPWLGFENTLGRPARVLGIFLEDSKRRLRKRLWELCRARGITPNHEVLREHLRLSREPIRLPDEHKAIAKRLRAWRPDVIVIDNLTRVMVGDPNSTKDAAAFTKVWLQLCDELGATLMPLHHVKKQTENGRGGGDPFESLRGSSDFGAAARNLIVSRPFELEGAQVSEVRMRGNLDLRRESFALGFERSESLGKTMAKLLDRGDVEDLKRQAKDAAKAGKAAEKRGAIDQRDRRALTLAKDRGGEQGGCTKYTLAPILGASEATANRVLVALNGRGLLGPATDGWPITPAGLAFLEGRS